MKILFIHPDDVITQDETWTTTRIINIVSRLKKKGHEVRLVSFVLPGSRMRAHDVCGLPLLRLSRRRLLFFSNLCRLYSHALWADVIHVQKCFAHASLPAIILARFFKKPLHYDWDAWESAKYKQLLSKSPEGRFIAELEHAVPQYSSTVSVSSFQLYSRVLSLGLPDDRIFDTHVCVDIDVFKPVPPSAILKQRYSITKPVIMCVEQSFGGHCAHFLVQVAAKILQTHAVLFMFVGGENREMYALPEALKNDIVQHVIFTGPVMHDEIPEYLSIADIAVSCFEDNDIRRSTSPLNVVEYLACGKAVVASDVGEVRRFLGNAGTLVPADSVDALAEAIIELLENPEKRMQHENRARARAERLFSFDVTVASLEAAYTRGIEYLREEIPRSRRS